MGKLSKSTILEVLFWVAVAGIFFGYTFKFNQPIEIYKFGATGWPRVILLLIMLVALGNLYYNFKNGSKAQQDRVGMGDDPDEVSYDTLDIHVKTGFILIIPFLYALSLKPVGFYCATPVFIALIMCAWGERRWKFILGNTVFIYALLLVLFMLVLNAPLPQGNVSPFYDVSAFLLKMKTQFDELF
ncbi:MAG: tripartite tricarboxylate transporter TctB family protein [Paracoccaceae bacterium]|jgi:hypothetical protein|nr:tripartite tricarboxylate transporter TctB family protein [Paracoccaceae bacterium]